MSSRDILEIFTHAAFSLFFLSSVPTPPRIPTTSTPKQILPLFFFLPFLHEAGILPLVLKQPSSHSSSISRSAVSYLLRELRLLFVLIGALVTSTFFLLRPYYLSLSAVADHAILGRHLVQRRRSRVTADPEILFKVLMEDLVGVSSCVLTDMASHPNWFLLVESIYIKEREFQRDHPKLWIQQRLIFQIHSRQGWGGVLRVGKTF